MSDRDDFGAFLAGFLVGGITGAIVALLFAPQSGTETRAQLQEKGIELRERVVGEVQELKAKAEKVAAEARTRGQQAVENVRKAVGRKTPPEVEAGS